MSGVSRLAREAAGTSRLEWCEKLAVEWFILFLLRSDILILDTMCRRVLAVYLSRGVSGDRGNQSAAMHAWAVELSGR